MMIEVTPDGVLRRGATHRQHVQPFEGARVDPASLAVNGIDPWHPLRLAAPEQEALAAIFREVRRAARRTGNSDCAATYGDQCADADATANARPIDRTRGNYCGLLCGRSQYGRSRCESSRRTQH